MLRFPDGMRDELKAAAESNDRSMNAEIVQRLRATLEEDNTSRNRPRGDYDVVVQLSGSLRDRIRAEAEEMERTLNSEIVFTLEREYPELAPINDIVDMLNLALNRAKARGSKRDLYELEMTISKVYGFYVRDLVNEEIKPRDGNDAVRKLNTND